MYCSRQASNGRVSAASMAFWAAMDLRSWPGSGPAAPLSRASPARCRGPVLTGGRRSFQSCWHVRAPWCPAPGQRVRSGACISARPRARRRCSRCSRGWRPARQPGFARRQHFVTPLGQGHSLALALQQQAGLAATLGREVLVLLEFRDLFRVSGGLSDSRQCSKTHPADAWWAP